MDSGTTCHAGSNNLQLTQANTDHVPIETRTAAGDTQSTQSGTMIGSISGLKLKLDNVHKLPNLSRNLWSVSKTVDEGNTVVFNTSGVYVMDDNMVQFNRSDAKFSGKRLRNGLFAFLLSPLK